MGKMQNEINGSTAVYGLIGHPVAHSFSPLIHNTLAAELKENLVYTTFPVQSAAEVGAAVKGAAALGIQGLNVTVPYKSEVIPFLTEVEPVAKAIGAVNTLVPVRAEDGSILGYRGCNTDYLGLQRALEEMGVLLGGADVILIGAGGAARAVGYMCGRAGVRRLALLNRTREKARILASELQKAYPDMRIEVQGLSEAAATAGSMEKPFAIQCTSVGLAPDTEATPIEDPAFYERIEGAYDCIYNPEETRFLQLVHAAGKPGYNGMNMLLWQGILAFELWTGREPEGECIEEVRRRLYAFLRN